MRFFEQLLPETGLVCVAQPTDRGGYSHRFFEDLGDAVTYMQGVDASGKTVYLAQSSFLPVVLENQFANRSIPRGLPPEEYKRLRKGERTQELVAAVRSFWFDIDCGPEKFAKSPQASYPTQLDGIKALYRFCKETGLLHPTVVNSGNGLYAHWCLTEDISANQWTATATLLKGVAEAYGFKADPSRTSDCSSVLRPLGSHNRKNGEEKLVKLCGEIQAPMPYERFHERVLLCAEEKKLSTSVLTPPKKQDFAANSDFLSGLEGRPSSAHVIAGKCAQLQGIRDTQGNVDEPLWYAALGLLKYTIEAPQILHDWSAGSPDYDPQVTESKAEQWTFGPTSCNKFGSVNPAGCVGCRHKDKQKSPITLGYPDPEVADDPDGALSTPDPPSQFMRGKDGLYFKDEDGFVKFYSSDLYVSSISWDHSLGYETVTFKHKLPHDGWKEFTCRSAIFHDSKSALMTLHDNHVHVVGKKEKALMVHYVESFIERIGKQQRLGQLYSQMGWQEANGELHFVIGDKVVTPIGEETAGLAKNIPEVARAFTTYGDSTEWVKATAVLGRPGYEPLAFALLAGAFGAPLLRFTGFSGAIISLTGGTGTGKTMISNWVLSAYGDPTKLMLLRDDTRNMLISRLGLYGSLPLCVDEVTNIEAMDLSDLVYRITQGRDKGRLTKNAVERSSINSWNTIAITSSNASLIDKLGYAKVDASAEINRVFEYRVDTKVDKLLGRGVNRIIQANYGGVGAEYIRWMVANTATHTEKIDTLMAQIDKMLNARSDERFWSAIAAVAIYGGLAAKNLGLINFEVAPILRWLVETVNSMRATKNDYVSDSVSLLGRFIDQHSSGIIFVTDTNKKTCSLVREPHGPIIGRLEMDKNLLFISREELRRWLYRNFGSYDLAKFNLARDKVLLKHDTKKNFGAGTYLSGVQQVAWEIDLSNSMLAHVSQPLLNVVKGEKAGAV